jgi:hypothetical protein
MEKRIPKYRIEEISLLIKKQVAQAVKELNPDY